MTIANRDAQLAAWLDEYSPVLDVERQAALLAAVEVLLDAAPAHGGLLVSRGRVGVFAAAAAGAVLCGVWAAGAVVQAAAPLAVASLLLGQGG